MAYDIGPRIGIEGEREYKQALDEIARGQKVLASELGLVSEKFNGQEGSLEALTAKHDVLQRTLYGEREKVETLRKAVEDSAKAYGESDKRTEDWQIKLNKAEAELIKTERASKQAEEAIDKLSESERNGSEAAEDFGDKTENTNGKITGLGDMLDGIAGKLGVNLPDNIKNSINSFASFDASSIAVVGSIGAIAAALVKVEKKLIDVTKQSASYADSILTQSTVTGISTEKLQEYTYAAELLDVSVETITGSQTKLIRSMDSARDGSEEQAKAFQKLNIRITDTSGNLRNSEDVYWDVIEALGRVKNETERDALAMELLGKSARDLNPLIKGGAETMNELAKEAHDMGYVLDEEALESLGKVDDAIQRLTNSADGAKNKISTEFAPYLTESIEKVTKLIENGGEVLAKSGIVDAFGMLLESVTNILIPVDALTDEKLPALEKALRPVAKVIAGIGDALEFIAAFVKLDVKSALKSSGIGYALGLGPNNMQSLELEWTNKDAGRFEYNGVWYDSEEAAEKAKNADEKRKQAEKNLLSGNLDDTLDKSLELQRLYNEYLEIEWPKEKEAGYTSPYSISGFAKKIGFNSAGNVNYEGGYTWVGENGPEKVFLPAGTRIDNAQDSREGGDTYYYITIDAKNVKEFNDIINLVRNARMQNRKRKG